MRTQVLIRELSAVESNSKKVASAITGFCGMFGYIGALSSKVSTGFIEKEIKECKEKAELLEKFLTMLVK